MTVLALAGWVAGELAVAVAVVVACRPAVEVLVALEPIHPTPPQRRPVSKPRPEVFPGFVPFPFASSG